jgi:DNA-binding XRE family transcriptional regulator
LRFNGGKIHNGINRYFTGINMSYLTLNKISHALNLKLSFVLDLDNADTNLFKYKLDGDFDEILFIDNIKYYRKKLGKTQLDIDVSTNIDRTSISKYEKLKVVPRLDKIVMIALELGIEPYKLFSKAIV